MSLNVPGRTLRRLPLEARALIDGICQLSECVCILPAQDHELEALDESRIVLARPRERRDLNRVIDDKGRLPQIRLHMLLKKIVELVTYGLPTGVLQHQIGHARLP